MKMVEAIVKPSKACRIMGYSRDSFKRVHANTGPRA